MKALNYNLMKFTVLLILLTLAFRFLLSMMLQNQTFGGAGILAFGYGVLVFIIGWVFGRRDRLHLPLYDIGFRFHLVTYLVCNLIAEIWYLLGMQSDFESIRSVHLTVIIWGIVLLIHFLIYIVTRAKVIKGIKKSELFE